MGKLINKIPGSCLFQVYLARLRERMLYRSANLAMSTSILEALPGKLDIKRHSHSFLYISHIKMASAIIALSNPAVGETVLTPVKRRCDTGLVPIQIKSMDK